MRAVRTALAGLVAVVLLVVGTSAGPVAAATGVRSQLIIGECYVFTEGLPKNTEVRFTVLRKDGTRKAAKTVLSPSGSVEIACLAPFAVGDTLVIKRASGGLLRSLKIPKVTIALNRVNDKGSGVAPGGRSARLLSGPCDLSDELGDRLCGTGANQHDLTIPANGSWSRLATGPGYQPRGGDAAQLFLFTPQGDRISAVDRANLLEVTPGSAVVKGIGKPGATVTVVLKDGAVERGRATVKATKNGSFAVTLRKDGQPVFLALGDTLEGDVASDATLDVPESLALDLSATADDRVSGTCFAGQPYELMLADGPDALHATGTAGAGGEVVVEGLNDGPIAASVPVRLWCATAAGDRVRLTGTTS